MCIRDRWKRACCSRSSSARSARSSRAIWTPVSYTHLDVYKRQVFSFVGKIENVGFPEAVRIVAGKCGIPLPKREFSDVYKRQAFDHLDDVGLLLHGLGKIGHGAVLRIRLQLQPAHEQNASKSRSHDNQGGSRVKFHANGLYGSQMG